MKLKLVSTIMPTDGEQEVVEMWLEGTIVERAGVSYLRYEEVQQEGTIRTTIKLANEQAMIMRNGSVAMRLPLNTQQIERGHYENMHGAIPIEVETMTLQHNAAHREFATTYNLIIGGQSVGHYTLQITYTEVQA